MLKIFLVGVCALAVISGLDFCGAFVDMAAILRPLAAVSFGSSFVLYAAHVILLNLLTLVMYVLPTASVRNLLAFTLAVVRNSASR